jgi:short-subunit dehydrogenase
MVTSELLTERGYKVFGTSRHPSKVNGSTQKVEMLPLDVNSDQSVRECVETLLQKTGGRIDVLVNNAGFGSFGGVEETSIEEAKMQLETNLFGAVRMVKAVLPTMRKQGRGQIINIGSLAGFVAVPFQGFYAVSKFALEGYTEALRHETKGLGIVVSIVEPGFFHTNIGKSAKFAAARIDDYNQARKNALSEMKKREENGQDPRIVAEMILKIIESDKPRLHYAVGRDKTGLLFKRLLPQSTFEGQVRRMFKLDA